MPNASSRTSLETNVSAVPIGGRCAGETTEEVPELGRCGKSPTIITASTFADE